MILYSAYFFWLAMFLLNTSAYFDFLFKAVGISPGIKTFVIQIILLAITAVIMFTRRQRKALQPELVSIILIWIPLLGFCALRLDFSDPYSVVKFAKLFMMHFLCAVTITAAYLSSARLFTRYFYLVTIVLAALLGIEMVLNPSIFHYRTFIDRVTIDDINPIWLARAFAIAALCIFFLPLKSAMARLAKVPALGLCIAGILPTGSRGPLISLLLVIGVYWLFHEKNQGGKLVAKITAITFSLIFGLLLASSQIEKIASAYLDRSQGVNMLEESGRPQLFARAINDFVSSPLFGIGLGKFGAASVDRMQLGNKAHVSSQGYYPHNILMEFLSESGAIGLIFFILTLRPGRWMLGLDNPFVYFFMLAALFSMTSGDINANIGVTIFGVLARLAYRYPEKMNAMPKPRSNIPI